MITMPLTNLGSVLVDVRFQTFAISNQAIGIFDYSAREDYQTALCTPMLLIQMQIQDPWSTARSLEFQRHATHVGWRIVNASTANQRHGSIA